MQEHSHPRQASACNAQVRADSLPWSSETLFGVKVLLASRLGYNITQCGPEAAFIR